MENEKLLPKPLTDLPLPEKEIPAHLASQGDALRSYRSKWIKLGIVAIILLVLLGGVYMLGRNSVFKELNPTNPAIPPKSPVIYQGTPTPNPTASWKISDSKTNPGWKTYTNIKNGFSIEYPADILIAENDACSSIKNDYLGLFKKRAEGKYLCGSDELYYLYVNIVDKKELSENNACYTNSKRVVVVDGVTAEEYTVTFRKEDKTCSEAGIGPVSTKTISIYISRNGKLYLLTWPILDLDNSTYNKILSTFTFSDSASSIDTSTWKTYNSTCGFSVSYPNSWSAKKFFLEDSENACTYITAPDYKMWTDSRDGFYIGVTRTKLGSKGINTIINSLEDYIKDDESIMTPRVSVGEKVNKTYGSLSGISYLPVGFEPGRSFIFIKGDYLYNINWSDKEESNHIAEINEIIKSFKFTQ